MKRLLELHWTTCISMLAVLAVFMWLNFDYTRDAYDENVDGGWRGGVRHGFPMIAWDSGNESRAALRGDRLSLSMHAYGGWQPLGVVVNALVFVAALAGAAFVSEYATRRSLLARRTAVPARGISLHLAVYPAVVLTAAAVLWANISVGTRIVEFPDGTCDYQQEMGWPLQFYVASRPNLKASLPKGSESLTKADTLLLLHANPRAWFRRAHWYLPQLTLNVLICLALVAAVAAGTQLCLKRRPPGAEIGAPAVVLPGQSD